MIFCPISVSLLRNSMPAMVNKHSLILHLLPGELVAVNKILKKHVPEYPIWVFGSRAGGTPRASSDLDLAIITKKPLSLSCMAEMREDFSQSDLPFKVDLVDWATIT